jgi:hypothetical protein
MFKRFLAPAGFQVFSIYELPTGMCPAGGVRNYGYLRCITGIDSVTTCNNGAGELI